jgi:hypothetical protein
MNSWIELGAVQPRRLVSARLELHRASQIVADVGRTFGPFKSDDSHTSMRFLPSRHALAGGFTRAETAVRALLQPSPLSISVHTKYWTVGILLLSGVSAGEAWGWMESAVGKPLSRFRFELPDGPGGGSQPFRGEPLSHFEELTAWYGNAEAMLSETRKALTRASSVRCWPHHFDIAFLLPIYRGRGKTKGSIGVGLSPGDEYYGEPYWYVTPWPHADRPALPLLAGGGRWHRRGWTGAVLTGSRVVDAGGAREQARVSRTFLKSAIDSCKRVIAAAGGQP